jgi:SAM-dependent methyltransferase
MSPALRRRLGALELEKMSQVRWPHVDLQLVRGAAQVAGDAKLLEAGLLARLAQGGFGQRLSGLHAATGDLDALIGPAELAEYQEPATLMQVTQRLHQVRHARHPTRLASRRKRRLGYIVHRASLWLAISSLLSACHYPSKPAAWARIDAERPWRAPDVPYEPSSDRAIDAMLELGRPTPADVVYDLGCGDGRVVITAVERSGARGVCIDIDPKLVRRAQENAARAGVSARIEFRTQDLFLADVHDATVVMLFLWPEVNRKLLPKLLAELPAGARIVSNMHDMGDYPPERTIELPSYRQRPHRVYLWRVPSRPL